MRYFAIATCLFFFSSAMAEPLSLKPLPLSANITSGWDKSVTYTTSGKNGNVLEITGSSAQSDADSINIGHLDNSDGQYTKLVITVEQISGAFPWGDKAIGISVSDTALEDFDVATSNTFIAPSGRAVEDNFIKGKLSPGERLSFDISNKKGPIYMGAKVFVGSNTKLKLRFDIQGGAQAKGRQKTP